jgi:hypothetical protein
MALAAGTLVVTAASARTSTAHWCRQGDPPIYASARTGCALAGRIVTDYVNTWQRSRWCEMQVYSAVIGVPYQIVCHRRRDEAIGTVECHGGSISGIRGRFSADI